MLTELSDRGSLHLRRKEISRSFLEWSLGVQEDLWQRLSEIQVPVLWLTGEHDEKFSAIAQRACELIPDASHRLIQAAGHRLPWQQPQVFTGQVLDFLCEN
jgi:2-succinyl-6-hydroxy-2,4-cyclohexadiene-1-carboxylate synthase